jgi:hypothetical protein
LEIDFGNIPDYILLDIDLGADSHGGVLGIKNANNMSVLPKFKKLNVQSLGPEDSSCTLDSPQEQSYMGSLTLTQSTHNLSVDLGDLSNVEIEHVTIGYESCVDLTPLKNVKEFKSLKIQATNGSVYNLNGLKGEFLEIMRCEKPDKNVKVTGKFDFDSIYAYGIEVDGLPSNLKKFQDTYGYSLVKVKSVQEFVLGPWIDDIADQILAKLHTGALKIKTITHYQAPYENIPYDEFITTLRMRYVRYAVLGEYGKTKGHWDRISIDLDKFQTWAKSTKKYEIVSSNDKFPGKLYMILKDGAPIGAYIEDNGGHRGWSSVYTENVLCTSDKQLMSELVGL